MDIIEMKDEIDGGGDICFETDIGTNSDGLCVTIMDEGENSYYTMSRAQVMKLIQDLPKLIDNK